MGMGMIGSVMMGSVSMEHAAAQRGRGREGRRSVHARQLCLANPNPNTIPPGQHAEACGAARHSNLSTPSHPATATTTAPAPSARPASPMRNATGPAQPRHGFDATSSCPWFMAYTTPHMRPAPEKRLRPPAPVPTTLRLGGPASLDPGAISPAVSGAAVWPCPLALHAGATAAVPHRARAPALVGPAASRAWPFWSACWAGSTGRSGTCAGARQGT